MSNLSLILKQRRKELGLTLAQIADKMGVAEATVQRWESGNIKSLRHEKIGPLAEILKVTPAAIMGWETDSAEQEVPEGFQPMPEMTEVPLVGQIACGEPITAEENLEGYVSVPTAWRATFTLLCRGDSMLPTFQDGDLVAIRSQRQVENGEVAAVRIEGEATLKRVYLYPDRIILQPENHSFAPIVKVGEEMNQVSIEGKAVGLCRGL